jgi:hypothetical protein
MQLRIFSKNSLNFKAYFNVHRGVLRGILIIKNHSKQIVIFFDLNQCRFGG